MPRKENKRCLGIKKNKPFNGVHPKRAPGELYPRPNPHMEELIPSLSFSLGSKWAPRESPNWAEFSVLN